MYYTSLEKQAVNKLLQYDNALFLLLKQQFDNSTPIKRETSTAWFFTYIQVDKNKFKPIPLKSQRIIFWDVVCLVDWKDFM